MYTKDQDTITTERNFRLVDLNPIIWRLFYGVNWWSVVHAWPKNGPLKETTDTASNTCSTTSLRFSPLANVRNIT